MNLRRGFEHLPLPRPMGVSLCVICSAHLVISCSFNLISLSWKSPVVLENSVVVVLFSVFPK